MTEPMSLRQRIRAAIKAAGRPLTIGELRAAIPDEAERLYLNVCQMAKNGMLTRSGKLRHYTYGIGRDPKRPAVLTDEERRRRRRERENRRARERYHAMTPEQRAVARQKRGSAKAASPDKATSLSERVRQFIVQAGRPVTFGEIREAFQEARVDSVLGTLVYRGLVLSDGPYGQRTYTPGRAPRWKRAAAKQKPKAEPRKAPRPSLAPAPSVLWAAQAPAAPRAETVEEWMQRTGRRPERLEGFAGVKPLPRMPVRSY